MESEKKAVAFWKKRVERGHSFPCRASLPGVFPNLSPEVVILAHSEGRRWKEGKKGAWWLTDPSEVVLVEMSNAVVSSRLD